MRFFRIPSFTGIEAHRDDADRGSLRVVEGCLPHGPGGLRSGPVWKKVGDLSSYSESSVNQIQGMDDGQGNTLLLSTRLCEAHDCALLSTPGTKIEQFGETYDVAVPEGTLYSSKKTTVSSVGNRLYAVGDGSYEALYVGKGPVQLETFEVFPDEELYKQEWSRFPKCQYFARGPKSVLFAAGNPDSPLTVYVSEIPGLTSNLKDTPYSTEDTVYSSGRLSTVEILGSDASQITALSTRGEQVVVHTDAGSFLLYAPTGDQANTGYRVEQVPATNFSAAVNQQVVSGESGTQTFWIGHDGQVYKDEAASRGSAELKSYADQDQANWKSKGAWELEHPANMENSFAAFDGQTGTYAFFIEDPSYNSIDPPERPVNLQTDTYIEFNTYWRAAFGPWVGISEVDCLNVSPKRCCERTNENFQSLFHHKHGAECVERTAAEGGCCEDAAVADCCYNPNVYIIEDCLCKSVSEVPDGVESFPTIEACQAERALKTECKSYDLTNCQCVENTAGTGTYAGLTACEAAKASDNECKSYDLTECECVENFTGTGVYADITACQNVLDLDASCEPTYDIVDCVCVENTSGTGEHSTYTECVEFMKTTDCYGWAATGDGCGCESVWGGPAITWPPGVYETEQGCVSSLDPNNCAPSIEIVYTFKKQTLLEPGDTTAVSVEFSRSQNWVDDLNELFLTESVRRFLETNEFVDQDDPLETIYFGIHIVPQEGWIYDLIIPKPGLDGPFSTLYSSDYGSPDTSSGAEGALQLGQVQVFEFTPVPGYSYSEYWADPGPPQGEFVFKLTKRPAPVPMYNFLGCESGFENACFRDDEHGTLTEEQCYDQYTACMTSNCDSTLQIYEVSGSDCVCATDPNSTFNLTECECQDGGFSIDNGINCNPDVSYDLDCTFGCTERQDSLGEFPDMTSCDDEYMLRCL